MSAPLSTLNAINLFGKFGPQRISQLRRVLPSFEEIWRANRATMLSSGLAEELIDEFIAFRPTIDIEAEWQKLQQEGITLIANFPRLLSEIYTPPICLYIKGSLPDAKLPTIAIVGSRKVSQYGLQVTEQFAEELARAGIVIISGLAYGVDTIAHRAAVKNHTPTIAVLGCGIDSNTIYPRSNNSLAHEIIQSGGAIVSEYPIGTLPFKQHFPHRNRIISGLSLGVLVIEATEDSGSLITAKHALEQNRELFAVPGSIYSLMSKGTNNLIKMGANCVTSSQDILDILHLTELRHLTTDSPLIPDTYEESLILPHLSKEPIHIDALVIKSTLPTQIVSATLTMMEMKGKARNLGGMLYIRTR